ncbi:MFS transporter [Rugosimonospora africana]|uniref:MFS transporter n=1 Tax=Rugosimonospora africana TaxID=556532 RepID=A0A8J3QP63_9ACTN|nr:MFS transporter [Rugosimonospora africana]GIH12953.1 MFS transporter [Rugosimonospora africana]
MTALRRVDLRPVALRRPDFRRLWVAGLISDTGDWLLLTSLPILVYQLTGTTLGTAYAFLIELAPAVALAPLAGRLADRLDRRALLIAVSLAQAAALVPLAFWPRLPVVYAVIAVEAALTCLFDPAKNALLPTLVEADELVSANSMIGLNLNLGRLVGGPLGGLLLGFGDLRAIVAVDAVSFLLAVLLIARVRAARPPAPDDSPELTHPAGGHPLGRPAVRASLLVAFVASIAQGLFIVLFVVFVARVLAGDAAETGLLRGVQAIGAIGGGLLLAFAHRSGSSRGTGRADPSRSGDRSGSLAGLACIAFGVVALLTWNAPRLTTAEPLYVVLFIAAGAPGLAMVAGLTSVLQQSTVDGERGRVFAAFGVAMATGQAAGMLAGGLLGDRLGVVPLLNAQGCAYLLAGALALVWLTGRRAAAGAHGPEPVHDPVRRGLEPNSAASSAEPNSREPNSAASSSAVAEPDLR